ncbi:hypothetical protein EJ110_NYTH53161 [Nymphaea thermarum]|nr:hypothetical protein EJ110_NYTH53161 [Nymphaea thermarum]
MEDHPTQPNRFDLGKIQGGYSGQVAWGVKKAKPCFRFIDLLSESCLSSVLPGVGHRTSFSLFQTGLRSSLSRGPLLSFSPPLLRLLCLLYKRRGRMLVLFIPFLSNLTSSLPSSIVDSLFWTLPPLRLWMLLFLRTVSKINTQVLRNVLSVQPKDAMTDRWLSEDPFRPIVSAEKKKAEVVQAEATEMEYHRKGKRRAGPSSEAHREPSPTHSDAHTPRGDSVSEPQFAQLGGGAQTPPRQTPPVDQQTILLTTLQTLTMLVQSMVGNQRSNASPAGDTSAPVREKATIVSYQQFMAMQPPIFSGGGSHDKANDWIEEVERIFRLLKVPEEDRVKYGSYLLKGDAKNWWQSTSEIRFAGQESITWKQFRDSFFSTYFPVYARDKKMQEFLDLQQNQSSLEEYITRYRHLEVFCPHLYTIDEARAGKFVRGLREGLRSKVLTSRPRDLDEAFTMARCIEEDWVRTQKDHQKKTGQPSQGGRTQVKRQHFVGRTRPYERRDDQTFRQNQPTRSEATQGSVATPTSQKCPTCSRVHPGKPCYRVTGACLHCGGMGHFIKDCPLKKERDAKKPEAGSSSARQTAEKKKAEVVQAEATEVVPAVSGGAGSETPLGDLTFTSYQRVGGWGGVDGSEFWLCEDRSKA